jgi:hypothetical protein
MTEHDLSAIFRRAQAEIRADVLAGHVPADVPDFAALHDYTDANVYGGICDGDSPVWDAAGSPDIDAINRLQNCLSAWIKSGALRSLNPSADA